MKRIILLLTGLIILTLKNQAQTVKDIEENVYDTVHIGIQIWFKENLKTTKYNDGTDIPIITDTNEWFTLTTPAYCNYNNTTNVDTINTYGRLYNWYTVNTNKLCPTGYHVPTDAEWTTLTTFLGDILTAGSKLKEVGTMHWDAPNSDATNETNFTALPGGFRNDNGNFYNFGDAGGWWTSTEYDATYVWYRYMGFDFGNVGKRDNYKSCGISVRCIGDLSNQINKIENNNKFILFPNPSTDKIVIDCTENQNILYIYNVIGELVFQRQMDNGINKIDVSNLQTGIYIIKLENEQGTVQQKLIKK